MATDTGRRSRLVRRVPKKRYLTAVPSPEKIKFQLVELNLPQIASWDIESGVDASGDNAFWAWGTVKSNKVNPDDLLKVSEAVREAISNHFKDNAPWVYVRFRDSPAG